MKTIYPFQDFENISFSGFHCTLPQETVDIINNIAELVGAPNYIHTPIFTKQPKVVSHLNKYSKRKSEDATSREDWTKVRSFKATVLNQSVGVDIIIDAIRISLNKISDKNYVAQYEDIKTNILKIMDDPERAPETMHKISTFIFDIASSNKIFSKIYAKLYFDLMNEFHPLKDVFHTKFLGVLECFTDIQYIDPNVNYDGFCEMNKKNEKRIALAMFVLQLMHHSVITMDQIVDIVLTLQNTLTSYIHQEDKKNEIDELSNLLFVLCSEPVIRGHAKWGDILKTIREISTTKAKDTKSLTSKSIFKHMDLMDLLK